VQRCLLHELKRLYSGTNNGHLFLGVRRAAALLGVNKDTAARAFKFLENRGFVRANQEGSFQWKTDAGKTAGGLATTWILTEFEFGNQLATKNFMAWRATPDSLAWMPPPPRKKRGPKSGDKVSPKTGQSRSEKAGLAANCPLEPDTFGQSDAEAVPLSRTHIVNQGRGPQRARATLWPRLLGEPSAWFDRFGKSQSLALAMVADNTAAKSAAA
jgi:DNA-binding transcriptional MocR family regulator